MLEYFKFWELTLNKIITMIYARKYCRSTIMDQ